MLQTVHFEETERLAALRRMELMDTLPEPEFDELVEIAAAICEVPISLVTLLDDKRQWFKAALGMEARETPREFAFCAHAIQHADLFLVEDAMNDPRFLDNPLVTGSLNVRFYAGVPVSSPDGFPLGTLCVLDRVPRTLTPTQVATLKVLGKQVNARMELRIQRRRMEQALAAAEEARTKLAASERRFLTFMDSGPFMSFLKDADGRMLFYNSTVAEVFGIGREDWLGKADDELFSPEAAARYRRDDCKVLAGESIIVSEEIPQDDGSVSTWHSYKFPCGDEDGRTLVGGVSIDVTIELERGAELQRSREELEKANAQLHALASIDALTGVANRRVFDERLAVEFAQSRRRERSLSVLILDIDYFKRRNDTYGHQAGDEILRQFAALLQNSVRDGDLAARYGGEEFAILLPEADEEQALQLAERIRATIHAEKWRHEPLTASVGAATLTAATPNPQRLVSLADEALYHAKRSGRDMVVGYGDYYKKVLAEIDNKK